MKAIKRNVVGLVRFIGLLFLMLIPVPRTTTEPRRDKPHQDKYEAIIGPSVPLNVGETKFCPRCHALVAQVRYTKQGTQIIQNGRVKLTVAGNVTISGDGKTTTGFPIRCPNGHTVRIE